MRSSFLVLMFFLTLAFACKDSRNSKIAGKWIGLTKSDGMIEFMDDGTSFWNTLNKRDYKFINDDMIEVTWMTTRRKLDVEYRGDTLVLTGPETRNRYIRFDVIEKSDLINADLIRKKIWEMRRIGFIELRAEKVTPEQLKEKILYDENRIAQIFKPDVQLYYATALLSDSSRIEVVSQPALGMPHLDATVFETLESRILHHFNSVFVSSKFSKIGVGSKTEKGFLGTISNDKGEEMKFSIVYGQSPLLDITDRQTINIGTRYLLNKQLGQDICTNVEFESNLKNGTATMSDGMKVPVSINEVGEWALHPSQEQAKKMALAYFKNTAFGASAITEFRQLKNEDYFIAFKPLSNPEYTIKGTYFADRADMCPIDEPGNLGVAVLAQVNSKEKIAKEVKFTSRGKGLYEGEIIPLQQGLPTRKVVLKHEGKSYIWEIVAQQGKSQVLEAEEKKQTEKFRKVKPIIGAVQK